MATSHRRAPSKSGASNTKIASLAADQLAKDLSRKLAIGNAKGKEKESVSPEATRLASMRSVNAASQSLLTIVQSGWKKSSANASKTSLNTVNSAANDAAKHLAVLRRLSPGDLDIERAAMSVLGKLMALELFDLASSALSEMHPRICALLKVSDSSSKLNLLSISVPISLPTNTVVLTLVSSYLLYAIVLASRADNTTPKATQELAPALESSSLLKWVPLFQSLPSKHNDSLLTRAYTVLTKFCSSFTAKSSPKPTTSRSAPEPSPESIFSIRMYALRCLAQTSSGIIEGNTFWDQATRFATIFVKSASSTPTAEERTTTIVLGAFRDVVDLAGRRPDNEVFMAGDENGQNFVDFCDYWASFAKRAGDICLLQKINELIQHPSSSSSTVSPMKPSSTPKELTTTRNTDKHPLVVEGTKLCNTLAQLALLLESAIKSQELLDSEGGRELLSRTRECVTLLSSTDVTIFLRPPETSNETSKDDQNFHRICTKVDRALEKVRRSSLKLLEPSLSSSTPKLDEALRELLSICIDTLQTQVSTADIDISSIPDALSRALDTLFTLSRTKLKVDNPSTYIPAFELLTQACSILNSIPSNISQIPTTTPPSESLDIPNYTRCISGAFYNIAGQMYQASRYGNTVPFLVESCKLGEKALSMPRVTKSGGSREDEREKEWKMLEEGLFRRWELLGVCYSKNGDRKNAYNAFRSAIRTFPFVSSGFAAQTDVQAPDALFNTAECTPAVKQLASLVDRVSYIGACELFLPPEEISLRALLDGGTSRTGIDVERNASVIGALLERQLDSLEPSRWKEGVREIFVRLLKDVLDVYGVDVSGGTEQRLSMPIRKAKVLVRCMEFAYRDSGDGLILNLGYVGIEDVSEQVERLSSLDTFGRDSSLSYLTPQYLIAANLWIALHAHRRADPEQNTIMTQRSEEACRLIKDLLTRGAGNSPRTSRRPSSPPVVPKTKRGAAASAAVKSNAVKMVSPPRTTRGAAARKMPAAPRKAAPVRKAKVGTVDPVTPKIRTRAALQPVSFNTVKPPRTSIDGALTASKASLVFDNFEGLLTLLQLVARILGLLSLVLAKAHILDMTRKLAQRHSGPTSDGYVIASLDLAHEYVTLGKLRRAASIFNPALEIVRDGQASQDVSIRLLLRFAESLAVFEDVQKSSEVYLEAMELSKHLDLEQKGMSTQQRIHARAKLLEITATAAHVFAMIQHSKGDVCASLEGFLQSLRLWNRAVGTLTRLHPSPTTQDPDPFEMSSLKDALPVTGATSEEPEEPISKPSVKQQTPMECLEWRVSEGLLSALFSLTEVYYLRGSAREAEYFARQAGDLSEQLNAPAMISRALARQGELQLYMGRLEDAQVNLDKAAQLLQDMPGLDAADVRRLRVEYGSRMEEVDEDPREIVEETVAMVEALDKAFKQFDSSAFGPRRSLGASPAQKIQLDMLAPTLLSSVLCQQLWLLRDDVGDLFDAILEKFLSLSYSSNTKAAEHALMAKLTLHSVYGRFRGDMFLSSLTESTISVPIGMGKKEELKTVPPSPDILDALANAEKLLWTHLAIAATTGSIIKVREAIVSLVQIGAFQTSLGDRRLDLPTIMATLLDISSSLTLRRDMLEAIDHKFPNKCLDDLQWPSVDGRPPLRPTTLAKRKSRVASLSDSEDEDEDDDENTLFGSEKSVKDYWASVRRKYLAQFSDPSSLSVSDTTDLPTNWTVINISLTPDKSTLFCSRREGGDGSSEPLMFCIPLKDRRDHGGGDEDEDYLAFDDAIRELQDIVRTSDECTKAAINIKADDQDGRSNWWKQRQQLDTRMRELLENVEYCWLGAFKTILSPRPIISSDAISDLRKQFEKVFHRSLHVKDKKTKKTPVHRKTASQAPTYSPNQFSLDDNLLKCFSTLSPKCRDEELEDLVYFVLDLYQFHGVPVAIAEVDIDQVVVDLRTVLEECAAKQAKHDKSLKSQNLDEHLFLVLDKNVQGLPWESIPILRGRSVSRIPGVQFLHDRIAFAKCKREAAGQVHEHKDGAVVDPCKGYFILNPSGDLGRTEDRFREWANGMKTMGWDGIIGQPVSEQQFVNALKSQDLVVYFGHGGGEQYIRSQRIRHLPTCAATMLWGCSSGALRDMGEFDRTGTPYNYMLAGCPTLVVNLWDVTDKDIDKFSQSVFDKLSLNGKDLMQQATKRTRSPTSLVAAVAQSRNSCKLKYLTGAAPIVYGIPFYL